MGSHKCPRCGNETQQAGVATLDFAGQQREYPVFQCDHCIVPLDFGGSTIDGNYTFALDEQGRPFDPAHPEGLPDGPGTC